MTVNRVQSIRSSVPGARPTGRPPGEIFTNFPDLQLGVVNAAGAAVDLVAVRYFSTLAAYVVGDYVVNAGNLYRATAPSAAGAFVAGNWSKVTSLVDTAVYVPLAGGTMTGKLVTPATVAGDLSGTAATKGYVDAADAPKATTAYVDAADALKANLASPVFTGDPTAPTPATADSDTSIATTAFVKAQGYAPLLSPALAGTPTAPTPATADNDTSIATTAFVKAQGYVTAASPVFTGNPTAPTPTPGDNDTSIATTAFVQAARGAALGRVILGSTRVFKASGTYTPTPGMLYCIIECVGGGGGAGGTAQAPAGDGVGSGGGGGGEYARKVASATDIGVSKVVTVGNGGAGGVGNAIGVAGGTSSVGTLCVAVGGNPSPGAPAGTSGLGGTGGNGGTGDFTVLGQDGKRGFYSTVTGTVLYSGDGGSSGLGFGHGAWGAVTNNDGSPGRPYGGGGSGGQANNLQGNSTGGAGATGIVIITEFVQAA